MTRMDCTCVFIFLITMYSLCKWKTQRFATVIYQMVAEAWYFYDTSTTHDYFLKKFIYF